MEQIIKNAKTLFLDNIKTYWQDPYWLVNHVEEVEKWWKYMNKKYPESDIDVIILSAWLHDIWHYPIWDIDHAIISEQKAKVFLDNEKCNAKITKNILHCIRSHRCRDVLPETLEAKIVAFIDSASHMTDTMYLDILRHDKIEWLGSERALQKLWRDYRDLTFFPEVKEELNELYESWKNLLINFDKINL